MPYQFYDPRSVNVKHKRHFQYLFVGLIISALLPDNGYIFQACRLIAPHSVLRFFQKTNIIFQGL
jgi:hypothetical protein